MNGRFNRRSLKHYLVLKDVQLRIVIINFIHMLLVVLTTLAAIVIPLYILLIDSPNLEDQYHAAIFLIIITEPVPIAMLLVMLLFIAHQIIITHQFCGPIINFSHTFREILRGNLTRKVRLRRHDLLKKEAAEINAMTDTLARAIGSMKQDHAGLVQALQALCATGHGMDAELRVSLESALHTARHIQKNYEFFTTEAPSAESN